MIAENNVREKFTKKVQLNEIVLKIFLTESKCTPIRINKTLL